MATCEQCRGPLPEGARFCPSCGAPQRTSHDGPTGEARRVVTVLFGDCVGFTALAEHRDPEQVKRLVDEAFQRLVDDVEAHGGVVDKLLGDAIVALFGAPVAHEDDADRAVRAAFAMQRTLEAFREEHPADDLRMRIGINTGEVLVGTVAGTDYTAMGDVMNTASRLQALAPTDAIYVGGATRALCSPSVHFREIESVRLRGRLAPTDVWEAVAIERADPRRRWTSDLPFVGRRSEMSILRAVTRSVEAGRAAVVAVSGEAGIGKSRLVAEAVAEFAVEHRRLIVLDGACAPYAETNVWWPVLGSVIEHLGLDRTFDDGTARAEVAAALEPLRETTTSAEQFDQLIEFMLHALGQPSALDALGPKAVRDAVVWGTVYGVRVSAARAPVVIWIDDVQWAAPVLLDLLEALAVQLATLPVLIITTMRDEDQVQVPWPPSVDPVLTMHLSLQPLPEVDADDLVREAAGRELPAPVRSAIASRSGGNPLFLIELARLAAESDAAEAADLPGTLRALIAAQLDRLPPAQRQIIDNAALIGNEGKIGSLRTFAQYLGQTFDPDTFDALCESGLLVSDSRRWQFRSDVLREVAYQTLTKQVRAQRHAASAAYLSQVEPHAIDRRAEHMASAAEVTAELGAIEGVPPDAADQAVELLTISARRWQRQGATRRGLDSADRGLRLLPFTTSRSQHDSRRRALELVRIELLSDLHRYREARDAIAGLRPEADAAGDRVVAAEASRLLGTIEMMDGDLVAARNELTRAVAEFRELDDRAHLAEALRARGFAEVFGGSLADAEDHLREAERIFATEVDDQRGAAWVQQNLAWASLIVGDHVTAEARLNRAMAGFEAINDRAGRTWSIGLLAYVNHFARRGDDALALAEEALEEARRWGDVWASSMMLNLQASVYLWRGEIARALTLAERALAGFRRIDDRFGQIQALGSLMRARAANGDVAAAERAIEEVLVLSGSFGEMSYPDLAAAGASMHLGRGAEASRLARQAIERLDTTGANVDEARVVLALGALLDGDAEAALAELLAVDVESSPFALAARALAAVLTGDREQARADADTVAGLDSGSYWDRVMAASAGYAAAFDRRERTERERWLNESLASTTDVVANAFVERMLGADTPWVDIGEWGPVAEQLRELAA